MAFQDASNFVLRVGLTSSTATTPVAGVTQFNDDADVQSTSVRIFGGDPLTYSSKNPRGFDGSMVVNPTDPGQIIIRDAYESQATIYAQSLEDGATGTQYPVKVTSYGAQRSADDNVLRANFTMEQNGNATEVPAP